MQTDTIDFQFCEELVQKFKQVVKHPIRSESPVYYVGVDLGTACVVTVVLDEDRQPVAGAYEYADVVKDGMVVDYIGAVDIVRRMKAELEEKLGVEELLYAAAAIPPGTDTLDGGAVKNVVEAAGYTITALEDESTAANEVLRIQNGAVVDIGGGTTGISIFRDGKVVYVADEPTGGTHFSLVLSGAYRKSFEEAELFKRDPANHKEILPVLKPVIEKVSMIISQHIAGYQVDSISLVGGTCCLAGIEDIIEKKTGVPTYKPADPMFVTPLGIAYSCTAEER
ncbi:MAG: ethanolamine utilization protein EutJ [Lachnospiraceae bacterium]|jgi:ethanolamine utilization protein EutJ|nr:ethanolamine utilization protein EutJ [Lachnospiraceae bacterium]